MKSGFYRGFMEITTVIGCVNNCSYCPQKLLTTRYGNKERVLSFENFEKILSKLPKDVRIDFSGYAEPFLNKDCIYMIDLAFFRGYEVSLFTTLIGVTPEILEKLHYIYLEDFYIHLPDNLGKTNIVVDENYLNCLDIVCREFKNAKFCYYCDSIHEKAKEVLDKYNITPNNTRLSSRAGNIKHLFKPLKKNRSCFCSCSKTLNHNVLLPNGDIYLCSYDFGLNHKIGNLLKQDYKSLFESNEIKKVKENLKYCKVGTLCYDCESGKQKYSLEHGKFLINKLIERIR